MTTETSLATRESPQSLGLRFAIPLDELRLQIAQLEEFKRDIMIEGVDYGVIPGTPKPTLFKPGAEKLTLVFGLAPTFEVTNRIEDWERGFFHYETRCDITNRRSGEVIASAHGSANSREPRYRWRDAKPACPDCGFDLRRSKRNPGDQAEAGWYCWGKIGGCGAQWPADTVTRVGRIENPEPYELVNTLLKMSEKRSLVAAALIATGGSGYFTQDMEDMPSAAGDDVVDATFTESGPQPIEVVRSADDRLWKRWLAVLAEAQGLGIPVKVIRLPLPRTELARLGAEVTTKIAERKQQIPVSGTTNAADSPTAAVSDAAPAESSPPDSDGAVVDDVKHPAWKRWQAAIKQAHVYQVEVPAMDLGVSVEQLEASTNTLLEMVADAKSVVAEL